MTIKKWLTLGAVGTALLLIPRRSSRQTMPKTRPENMSSAMPKEKSKPLSPKDQTSSSQAEDDNQT